MRAFHNLSPAEKAEANQFNLLSVSGRRSTTVSTRFLLLTRLIDASFHGTQRLRVPGDEDLYQELREDLLTDLEKGGFTDTRDRTISTFPDCFDNVSATILQPGDQSVYRLGAELTKLRRLAGGMSPYLAAIRIILMNNFADVEAFEAAAGAGTGSDIGASEQSTTPSKRKSRVEIDSKYIQCLFWHMHDNPPAGEKERFPSAQEVCDRLAGLRHQPVSEKVLRMKMRESGLGWRPPRPSEDVFCPEFSEV